MEIGRAIDRWNCRADDRRYIASERSIDRSIVDMEFIGTGLITKFIDRAVNRGLERQQDRWEAWCKCHI